jgi:hypothetical protein
VDHLPSSVEHACGVVFRPSTPYLELQPMSEMKQQLEDGSGMGQGDITGPPGSWGVAVELNAV